MRAMLHQNQLPGLRKARDPAITSDHELSFNQWLTIHVGEQDRDWGRIYDLNLGRPTYGTTWWFRDPTAATLTLLRWS